MPKASSGSMGSKCGTDRSYRMMLSAQPYSFREDKQKSGTTTKRVQMNSCWDGLVHETRWFCKWLLTGGGGSEGPCLRCSIGRGSDLEEHSPFAESDPIIVLHCCNSVLSTVAPTKLFVNLAIDRVTRC